MTTTLKGSTLFSQNSCLSRLNDINLLQTGLTLRRKLTPLQTISIRDRGNSNTTLEEELSNGITAMGYVREKGNPELLKLLGLYVVLSTKVKTSSGSEKSKYYAEFQDVSKKLFALAHKLGAFTDTRVVASAMIQSTDYLLQNPGGELSALARQVIEQLNTIESYGAVPMGSSSSFNPWLIVVILLSISLFHR
jgi:hypothetical protein